MQVVITVREFVDNIINIKNDHFINEKLPKIILFKLLLFIPQMKTFIFSMDEDQKTGGLFKTKSRIFLYQQINLW